MRALSALFFTAFLIAGCGRNETETAPPPMDSTAVPDTMTEPAPMPPPAEDMTAPGSAVPESEMPPSETTPPPSDPPTPTP